MIVSFSTFISVQWKWTFRSLRSFPFSGNERFVLYVHFRSVEMNVLFSTFISVHLKWTEMNVSFISVRSGPKVPKNDQKKGPFWGQKWLKNGQKLENERKWTQKMNDTFISVQYNWTVCSLRSFPFSTNEHFVHCIHFRSVEMNVSFTAFISVQYKWTFRSLRSFPFIKNERKWTKRSFGFHTSPKTRKMNGNERSV